MPARAPLDMPMALLTLGALSSTTSHCGPQPVTRARDMLFTLLVAWLVYAVPVAPAILLLRRWSRSLLANVGAIALAIVAILVAAMEMFALALATMC